MSSPLNITSHGATQVWTITLPGVGNAISDNGDRADAGTVLKWGMDSRVVPLAYHDPGRERRISRWRTAS